ncbi:hypothetical protein Acr_14g0001840 [Actinidia rufa]|uniref:Uncharacterized protein n=1 Tax=Actinidia rufa TaxID=165716 RepID=A0A7J0FPB0_9ERIC|nr:hypothetical protein Acr_14g0001840 [Actinidia rufa]
MMERNRRCSLRRLLDATAAGPNCKARMVRMGARAVFEKWLSNGQVMQRLVIISMSSRSTCGGCQKKPRRGSHLLSPNVPRDCLIQAPVQCPRRACVKRQPGSGAWPNSLGRVGAPMPASCPFFAWICHFASPRCHTSRDAHDIPHNVLTERSRPNEDANEVEGHVDCIPVQTRPRDVKTLLLYEPIYRHIISHRGNQLGQARLSHLHIKGKAPRHQRLSSVDVSREVDRVADSFWRLKEEAEGTSTGSSGASSFRVCLAFQATRRSALILIESLNSDTMDDLDFLPIQPVVGGKALDVGPSKRKMMGEGVISIGTLMPIELPRSGTPSLLLVSLGGKSPCHFPSIGAGRYASTGCGGPRRRWLNRVRAKNALRKANNLESDLKTARKELAVEKIARKANDSDATKTKLNVDVAQGKLHKVLQDLTKLQTMGTGPMYDRLAEVENEPETGKGGGGIEDENEDIPPDV